MDTLTHTLSGALVGRVLSASRKIATPKAAIVVGAVAGFFPDADFVFKLFGNEAYLWNHRGITHSFIFLPIWAALISYLFAVYFTKSKNKVSWVIESATKKDIFKDLYLISILGIVLHVIGDLVTSFGTMILWPNMTRYDYGSVFIIDLIFTGIIAVGLWISYKFGKTLKEKSRYAFAASLVLFAYIGFTQYVKILAVDDMKSYVTQQYPELKDENIKYMAFPDAFLFNNWIGLAYDEKTEKYYHKTFSVFGKKENDLNNIKVYNKWGDAKKADKAKEIFNLDIMEFPRFFMVAPTVTSSDENCVLFTDLRYKSAFRGKNPFVWGVCEDNPKEAIRFK